MAGKTKTKEPSAAMIRKMERIMSEGVVSVRCTARCGEGADVEPDGDYPCSCGRGRLRSPLVKYGII